MNLEIRCLGFERAYLCSGPLTKFVSIATFVVRPFVLGQLFCEAKESVSIVRLKTCQ